MNDETMDDLVARINCPVPFQGTPPVNLYLLRGDRPVLVDSGTGDAATRARIENALRALGVEPRQVAAVLVTHGHIDHAGGLEWIHQESGCRILVHADDRIKLTRNGDELEAYNRAHAEAMAGWGVPEQWLSVVDEFMRGLHRLSPPVPVEIVETYDGADLEVEGLHLRVHHRPGHSQGHVVLELVRDGSTACLLVGDHILEQISPIPGVYIPEYRGATSGLAHQMDSLASSTSFPDVLLFPGHGIPFKGLVRRVAAIRAEFETRRARILEVLAGEERSILELTGAIWKGLDPVNVGLGCRELAGHMEILENQGLVARRMEGPVGIFRRQSGAERPLFRSGSGIADETNSPEGSTAT